MGDVSATCSDTFMNSNSELNSFHKINNSTGYRLVHKCDSRAATTATLRVFQTEVDRILR